MKGKLSGFRKRIRRCPRGQEPEKPEKVICLPCLTCVTPSRPDPEAATPVAAAGPEDIEVLEQDILAAAGAAEVVEAALTGACRGACQVNAKEL